MDKAPLLTSEEIAAAVAAEKAKHQRADGEQRGTSTNKRRDKSTKFKLVPFEDIVPRVGENGPSSASPTTRVGGALRLAGNLQELSRDGPRTPCRARLGLGRAGDDTRRGRLYRRRECRRDAQAQDRL